VTRCIDLNADLGEGGAEDDDLLEVVTSASVACGFHAGSEETMRMACLAAVGRGVAIGAHVSYRDRAGFGRREIAVDARALEADVAEQIRALEACARAAGGRVLYVKPHGALYERARIDGERAAAIVSAIDATDMRLAVLGFPGSQLLAHALEAGLEVIAEAFADRAYRADGSLVARSEAGAVLDEESALSQALSIARDGFVLSSGGDRVPVEARSICVHGDTPGAARVARRLRAELETDGIDVRPAA
jgi:UPF0271 protein